MEDIEGLTQVEWYRKCLNQALDAEYRANPQFHGKMFRPKSAGPYENYVPMSFSRTLLDIAGGANELTKWWEPE